jgi:adenylate cyclase
MDRRKWIAVVFGVAVIAALTLLRLADPYPLQVARETSFDSYQQMLPRPVVGPLPVHIVDIDEETLAAIGQWPWPRDVFALLTQRLLEMGAAAVTLDLLFSEPDRMGPAGTEAGLSNDGRLAAALAGGPTVLAMAQSPRAVPTRLAPKGGLAVTGVDPLENLPVLGGVAQPLPELAAEASGLGVASLERGGGGVARRLPLLWNSDGKIFPTLAAEAMRVAMGVSTLVVLGDSDGHVDQLRIGDLSVPTGPEGDFWIYYRPLGDDVYTSAVGILGDDYTALTERIAGKIVLIGTSATGLLDIRTSALGEDVPGVTIHLQVLEQMMTGTFLDRADWVAGLEVLIFVTAGLLIVGSVVWTGPLMGLMVSLATVAAVTAVSWFAFSGARLLIDPSFPLLGILTLFAAMVVYRFATTDADRRRIRRAFAHYVEPSLLTQIEADEKLLRLGGEVRELTVMFSDVRNFSALGERVSPDALVGILNRLFGALGHAIVDHKGTIDKFMGDAVMAFWNAPVHIERHALFACRAALAMRAALDQLNAEGGEQINIGIGIASGPALVGNMGFAERFDYSCVGDTVNVAARLESMCRAVGHEIIVSAPTAAAAPELAFLDAGRVELKGMSEREPILVLVGDESVLESDAFGRLAAAHGALLALFAAGQGIAEAVDACRQQAIAIDPSLSGFYDALPGRLADFAPAGGIAESV